MLLGSRLVVAINGEIEKRYWQAWQQQEKVQAQY